MASGLNSGILFRTVKPSQMNILHPIQYIEKKDVLQLIFKELIYFSRQI